MVLLGLAVPFLARRMSERYKPAWNFAFLCGLVLIGLIGLGFVIPYWGILPAVCLFAAMHFMNFFVSRYLNAEADSDQRATVLSFKGLSTNVSYGAISILYSVLVAGIREVMPSDMRESAGAWNLRFVSSSSSRSLYSGYWLRWCCIV